MPNFKAFSDRVLIRRSETPEEQVVAGIVLVTNQDTPPSVGTVLAAGPDAVEAGVEVGQEVYFSQYAGTDITLDGEELLVIHVSDLFGAIIHEEG